MIATMLTEEQTNVQYEAEIVLLRDQLQQALEEIKLLTEELHRTKHEPADA